MAEMMERSYAMPGEYLHNDLRGNLTPAQINALFSKYGLDDRGPNQSRHELTAEDHLLQYSDCANDCCEMVKKGAKWLALVQSGKFYGSLPRLWKFAVLGKLQVWIDTMLYTI